MLEFEEGDGIQLECKEQLAASKGKGPLEWRPGDVRRCLVVRYDAIPGMHFRLFVILSPGAIQ